MANIEAYGTNIVGSGGSGGGGLTQQEHDWLESLASYTPNMYDINPNLLGDYTNPDCNGICLTYASTDWGAPGSNKIPVCGYKRIKMWTHRNSYSSIKGRFQLADGSYTTDFPAVNGWSDWITIPENAVSFCVSSTYNTYTTIYYSLSTSES